MQIGMCPFHCLISIQSYKTHLTKNYKDHTLINQDFPISICFSQQTKTFISTPTFPHKNHYYPKIKQKTTYQVHFELLRFTSNKLSRVHITSYVAILNDIHTEQKHCISVKNKLQKDNQCVLSKDIHIIFYSSQNIHMNFTPSIDKLALFDPDNIRNGDSLQTLKDLGKIEGLETALHTNYRKGIYKDQKDHEARVKQYGDNQPIVKPPKTIFELVVENFEDEMLRILCAAAAISLVLGILTEGLAEGWLEGASILIAVVIIVTVTSGNNYIKEKQFQKLNAMATAKDVHVYRGGDLIKMSVYDLLVGDVVQISTGEIFSVDGILIEGSDISVDESSLTGQTNEIKKRVPTTYEQGEQVSPFLISSSKLMSGTGLMVVCAVGVNSYYGKLKLKIQQDQDDTPLQIKLTDLADAVGLVGMYAAGATFAAMFIHYLYDCFVEGFIETFISVETIHEIIEYFIIAVSIVVVAVPEGLPLSVTIALAYSVGKMKDQNNLVRYLQACETMGGADNICSDKTGTLTKNLMTVTKIFAEQAVHETIAQEIVSANTCKLLCLGICNNSNANPKFVQQKGQALKIEQNGNKTECALLQVAYRMDYDYLQFRNRDKVKKIFPFNSEKKKMATVYEDEKGKLYLFVKGAPDFMIGSCSSYVNRDGGISKINQDFLDLLGETIDSFAAGCLRTILLTYKEVKTVPEDWNQIEKDLVILGMVGIKDPLREGIKDAVQMCKEGGVTVRMVTGDNKQTAIAIAKEAGILQQDWEPSEGDYTVMEGKEFRQFVGGLTTEEAEGEQEPREVVGDIQNFKLVRDQLRVLARSSPDDKYLMTTGLKQLDHVVAMTGDGTNDAPALKKADIGFAMGIAGTQVAKEASGIILLDDNFCSIVTAMKWGRNIFDSIRKFLQFQLTVNFVALVMAFVGGAILRESPLNPIQMLWVNLIMDTLASLALATEPPCDELLKRKPYSKREGLITAQMWKFIISQGLVQIAILGTILFKGPELFGIPSSIHVKEWNDETGKHYSIFFNVFVLLQVFNEINARKLKANEYNVFENFFNNKLFLVIVVCTIIIQLTMVKYGGESLKTVELSFKENLLCLLLGSVSLLSCLAFKVVLPEHLIICLQGVEFGSFKFYWKKVAQPRDQ